MKILQNDIKTIVDRKKNGEPASNIAKDFGVTAHAIYKVISKWEMDNDDIIKEKKEALKKTVLLHKTKRMMEEAGLDKTTINSFIEKQKVHKNSEIVKKLKDEIEEKDIIIKNLKEKSEENDLIIKELKMKLEKLFDNK